MKARLSSGTQEPAASALGRTARKPRGTGRAQSGVTPLRAKVFYPHSLALRDLGRQWLAAVGSVEFGESGQLTGGWGVRGDGGVCGVRRRRPRKNSRSRLWCQKAVLFNPGDRARGREERLVLYLGAGGGQVQGKFPVRFSYAEQDSRDRGLAVVKRRWLFPSCKVLASHRREPQAFGHGLPAG